MKLQFIASVAAVLLNSGHGVFAAKDEPKGLRGSLDFLEYQKSPESLCYDRCCDYAGEDQVLLGSLEFFKGDGNDYEGGRGRGGGGYCDGNECQGVFEEAGGYDVFCRTYNDGEGGGRGGPPPGYGPGGRFGPGGGLPGMPGSQGGPPGPGGRFGPGGGFPGMPGSQVGPPPNRGFNPGRMGYAPYYAEESE